MRVDDCSRYAIHDLAALAEGNLSQAGLQRLAGHLRSCRGCRATLTMIVEDDETSQRSSASRRLGAWLDAAAARDDIPASMTEASTTSDEVVDS